MMRLILFFVFVALICAVGYWLNHSVSNLALMSINEAMNKWEIQNQGWNIFINPFIIGIAIVFLFIGMSMQGVVVNLVNLANNYDKNDEIKAAKKRADEAEEIAKKNAEMFFDINKKDIATQQKNIEKNLEELSKSKTQLDKDKKELDLSKQELTKQEKELKQAKKDFESERNRLRKKTANATQAFQRTKNKLKRQNTSIADLN